MPSKSIDQRIKELQAKREKAENLKAAKANLDAAKKALAKARGK
jgi:hypothetical protein